MGVVHPIDSVALVLIVIGAVLMVGSVFRAGRARFLLSRFGGETRGKVRAGLLAHRTMMVLFLLGYAAVAVAILRGSHQVGNLAVGCIFLGGAVFVLLGLLVQERLLQEALSSYSDAVAGSKKLNEQKAALEEANSSLKAEMARREVLEQEKRELEQELFQAQKLDAVGQLAGGVAHDFNNMLGAILGYGNILRDELSEERPDLARRADAVCRAAERSADLTAKLLAFARKGRLETVRVDMHDTIGEVLSLARHTFEKDITLSTGLQAERTVVMGDSTQLQNAVLNLALNARDAMPDGGQLTIRTENVRVDSSGERDADGLPPGEYLAVHVCDTGSGMDEETLSHAFEPFYTTKESGRGSGLGLASVYGTVKGHGGSIDVESSPGSGTMFVVMLPVADADQDSPTKPLPQMSVAQLLSGLAGTRVLVVDDQPEMSGLVVDVLAHAGLEPTSFGMPEDALEHLAGSPMSYGLVVLDVAMPHMDGVECLSRIRAQMPSVPAILMSGNRKGAKVEEALAMAGTRFIQKPFRPVQLAQVIRELLKEAPQ